MDDKNLNSVPEEDGVSEAENLSDTVEAAEEESTEILSDEAESAEQAEAPEDGEVELAGGKKKKGRTKKGNRILIALIVVLLAATACMIGWLVKNSGLNVDLDKTVVTVDDVESGVGEFMYYYLQMNGYYSQYGYSQISSDELKESVVEQMKYINTVYSKAVQAGFELDDEDKQTIEDELAGAKEYAEANSTTADELLQDTYFKGFDLEFYRKMLEKTVLVNKYMSSELEEINKQFEGDAGLKAADGEYSKNKKDYDLSDAEYIYIASSDENAKSKAEAVVKAVVDGKSFADAAKSTDAKITALKGLGYSAISQNFSKDIADWVFAAGSDGNYTSVKGSVKLFETDSKVYVVYVNAAPSRDESYPVTVDYIPVQVETDNDIKSEDELKVEAKHSATQLLEKFNSAESKDEETFMALSQSASQYVSNGQSTNEIINAWGMAQERKVGDCEILEGDGVYYVVYFSAKSDIPVWQQNVVSVLVENAQQALEDEITAYFADKAVEDEEALAQAVAAVTKILESN